MKLNMTEAESSKTAEVCARCFKKWMQDQQKHVESRPAADARPRWRHFRKQPPSAQERPRRRLRLVWSPDVPQLQPSAVMELCSEPHNAELCTVPHSNYGMAVSVPWLPDFARALQLTAEDQRLLLQGISRSSQVQEYLQGFLLDMLASGRACGKAGMLRCKSGSSSSGSGSGNGQSHRSTWIPQVLAHRARQVRKQFAPKINNAQALQRAARELRLVAGGKPMLPANEGARLAILPWLTLLECFVFSIAARQQWRDVMRCASLICRRFSCQGRYFETDRNQSTDLYPKRALNSSRLRDARLLAFLASERLSVYFRAVDLLPVSHAVLGEECLLVSLLKMPNLEHVRIGTVGWSDNKQLRRFMNCLTNHGVCIDTTGIHITRATAQTWPWWTLEPLRLRT